jgi:hypothetical protein
MSESVIHRPKLANDTLHSTGGVLEFVGGSGYRQAEVQ